MDEGTASGLSFCAAVGAAVLIVAGAPVGIPLLGGAIGAKIYHSKKQKEFRQKEQEKRKRKGNKDMLPVSVRPTILPSSYDWDERPGLYGYQLPKNPITAIAEQSPSLASNVLMEQLLTDTHKTIVEKPAAIFASQGKGMTATTKRRKGFFSDSVTTKIKPHK